MVARVVQTGKYFRKLLYLNTTNENYPLLTNKLEEGAPRLVDKPDEGKV